MVEKRLSVHSTAEVFILFEVTTFGEDAKDGEKDEVGQVRNDQILHAMRTCRRTCSALAWPWLRVSLRGLEKRELLEWIEAYRSRENRSTEAFTLFNHAVVVSPPSPSPVIAIDS